jgi:hypothetical protein
VRYQRGVRSTRHETLDQVTFVGAATASARSRCCRARAQAILTILPAASRPHFLNR